MPTESNGDYWRSWSRVLDPAELRLNLSAAGIFLIGYEVLKGSLVDYPRGFFCGIPELEFPGGRRRYKAEVLRRDKDITVASLLWFQSRGAIAEGDVTEFHRIRQQRNALAHETLKYISKHSRTDYAPLLEAMLALLEKVETWWVVNIEVPSNEQFDGQEIHNEDVSSGVVIMMKLLVAAAFDVTQVTDHYLREQLRQ
jgi:hypothetical protein